MNSEQLQEYEASLKRLANANQLLDGILKQSFGCFVSLISRVIGGTAVPEGDLLQLTVQLLLISDGLSRLDQDSDDTRASHYLVGLGFEQSTELLTRDLSRLPQDSPQSLITDDVWYRLVLAFLHYSAAGYRIQARTVARHIVNLSQSRQTNLNTIALLYKEAENAVVRLRDGVAPPTNPALFATHNWESIFFGDDNLPERSFFKFRLLARQVQKRRLDLLERLGNTSLGIDEIPNWLTEHGLTPTGGAVTFWRQYLDNLKRRGYTSFTSSQEGPGFDKWLTLNSNLLTILPTGGGKTVIGELRSALTLASGHHVVWLLPTRPLVRQVKSTLKEAFSGMVVDVEELPPTDMLLTFEDLELSRPKSIAVTTPERLRNLLRGNPNAVSQIRLVVVDEAQILTEVGRAAAVEAALAQIRHQIPDCRFVLLSSAFDQTSQLRSFLDRLGGVTPIEINDSQRPTRRLCGVLTADKGVSTKYHPTLVLYPPRPITVSVPVGKNEPYRVVLKNITIPKKISPTDLATILTSKTSIAGLRTVVFAKTKSSAETQAHKLAKTNPQTRSISVGDTERLEAELGRPSQIQALASHGIACHHGAMLPIEQCMVEKWLIEGLVHTVVATPTLAQGVNLPFDIALISQIRRYNHQTQTNENIDQHEVQNMLGRAGRAGFVTDGLSLLAIQRGMELDPVFLLNQHRKTFFGGPENANRIVGIRRTLESAIVANAIKPTWLDELSGVAFADAQALVSFVCGASEIGVVSQEDYFAYLSRLPSVQEVVEKDKNRAIDYAELMKSISSHLTSRFEGDDAVKHVVAKTGFPVELTRFFIDKLRSTSGIREMNLEDQLSWYDSIILSGLQDNRVRSWCKELLGEHDIDGVYGAIRLWRAGKPTIDVEQILYSKTLPPDQGKARTKTVEFIRQKLPMLAQFWNTLAMCDVELYGEFDQYESPSTFHTLVREGVSSTQHSLCLHQLGGLDRVVSGVIAKVVKLPPKPSDARKAIRRIFYGWGRDNGHFTDDSLSNYSLPILALLNENRYTS